jgi:hypothetical protein
VTRVTRVTRVTLVTLVALAAAWYPADSRADSTDNADKTYGFFKFGGDMRGRFEMFRFSEDETGAKKDTRGRIRYRFRFDGDIKINPYAKFHFRIVSGNDSRSGNQTLGDPVDFGPNSIGIRRAMMVLAPWSDGKLPNGKGHWEFHFGRVKNPYVWKKRGQDKMLWDNDIALAGVSTVFDHQLGEPTRLFFNTGYYVVDENSSGNDPYLVAAQLGITGTGDGTQAGIRGSFYYFAELDSNFVQRGVDGSIKDGAATNSGGNIPDGLTGDPAGGELQVVEAQAYLKIRIGSVPLTAFTGYSQNLGAEASQLYPGVGKENVAYNIGLEGGNKRSAIKLGTAWFHIEANAFPSQFIDSDFLDGHTNRQGLLVYFQRQILKNTDFNIQLFHSDAIETGSSGLDPSVANSERVRLQVDLLYRF